MQRERSPDALADPTGGPTDNSADDSADDALQRPEPPPLARLHGDKPEAPAWFDAALADSPECSFVEVQGAQIEVLCWGRRGDPGLLLLHGNNAHAHWYSFIAPLVAQAGYRVAAMSFSGMGGSDWRAGYGIAQWSDEAEAVAEAAGLFDADIAPSCAAHSFGGLVLATIAARWGQRLRGAMIIDAPVRTPEQRAAHEARRRARKLAPSRVYLSVEEALSRFRFMPPQPCQLLYVVDHIARHSLKAVAGGVTWRFDPFLFRDFSFGTPLRDLTQSRCPLLLVRGGRSRLVTPEGLAYALSQSPPGTRCAEVQDADHHVMVDNPLGLVELLKRELQPGPGGAQ